MKASLTVDADRLAEIRHWLGRCKPMPRRRTTTPYTRELTREELARIARGIIPQGMDDRWVGILHETHIDFHRSWTGYHIFRLPLRFEDGRIFVDGIIANRDPNQYSNTDPARDIETVEGLLTWMIDGEP